MHQVHSCPDPLGVGSYSSGEELRREGKDAFHRRIRPSCLRRLHMQPWTKPVHFLSSLLCRHNFSGLHNSADLRQRQVTWPQFLYRSLSIMAAICHVSYACSEYFATDVCLILFRRLLQQQQQQQHEWRQQQHRLQPTEHLCDTSWHPAEWIHTLHSNDINLKC